MLSDRPLSVIIPERYYPSSHLEPIPDAPFSPLLEEPLHVDYVTHNWDLVDLFHSHRALQKSLKKETRVEDQFKKERLINTAWRKWSQCRFKLPKLNPCKLHWFVIFLISSVIYLSTKSLVFPLLFRQ